MPDWQFSFIVTRQETVKVDVSADDYDDAYYLAYEKVYVEENPNDDIVEVEFDDADHAYDDSFDRDELQGTAQ